MMSRTLAGAERGGEGEVAIDVEALSPKRPTERKRPRVVSVPDLPPSGGGPS